MALYSFFHVHTSELVHTLDRDCAHDLDALDAARGLYEDHTIEVYDDARFVGRVQTHDEVLRVEDRSPIHDERRHFFHFVVADAARAVESATECLIETVDRSRALVAQTSDSCSSSREALARSRAILRQLSKKAENNA